jgi:hypothetical protein
MRGINSEQATRCMESGETPEQFALLYLDTSSQCVNLRLAVGEGGGKV